VSWVPGWWIDPSLPILAEDEPRCDRCGRTLHDIAADNDGRLPLRHRATPEPTLYVVRCSRNRDDLLCLVFIAQRAAADQPTGATHART
jgi:hypothetical protein